MLEIFLLSCPPTQELNKSRERIMEKMNLLGVHEVIKLDQQKIRWNSLLSKMLLYWLASQKIPNYRISPLGLKNKGKPFFKEYPLFNFNISHSHTYISVAICEKEVGVDIERIRDFQGALAKRFLHPKESLFLENLEEDRNFYFTAIWSLKESYVKYTGEGIANLFNTFHVEIQAHTHQVLLHPNADCLHLHLLPLSDHFVISSCSQISSKPIIRPIDLEEMLLSIQ